MSSAVGDVFEHPSVPYRRHRIAGAEEIDAYGLEAPPALCAILGALGSFGVDPDLVVSGINAGANVGRSVLHSGTIGAILTGAQLGCPGSPSRCSGATTSTTTTAAAVAIEVLEQPDGRAAADPAQPQRAQRRPRASFAGCAADASRRPASCKSAGPSAGGEPLAEEGELPLRLGAATPGLGDVSDEDADDDGALIAAGYASLTPLRGPHEDTDAALDSTVRAALAAITAHLAAGR